MFSVRLAVVLSLLFRGQACFAEPPPTPEELGAVIFQTPISSTNPAIETFEVETEGMGIRHCVWFSRQHHTALWVLDARDGTPILAGAGGKVAIYNPMIGQVLLITNAYANFQFTLHHSPRPNKSSINFGYGLNGEPTNQPTQALLTSETTPMEMANLGRSVKALAGGPDRYRLEMSGSKTNLTWRMSGDFSMSRRPISLEMVDLAMNSKEEGWVIKANIKSINQPIPVSVFAFPENELKSSGLPLKIQGTSVEMTGELQGILMASLLARGAMSGDPKTFKEKMRAISRNFKGNDTKSKMVAMYQNPDTYLQYLKNLTPEQANELYAKIGRGISREEFDRRIKDPASQREMANRIVEDLRKPLEGEPPGGTSGMDQIRAMAGSMEEMGDWVEKADLSVIRANDQRISAQLRKAFQLAPSY